MSDDDPQDRTVTKPRAHVYEPPPDPDATVIKPRGALAAEPATEIASAPPTAPAAAPGPDMGNNLPVGTFLGEFELTELLGEGGFGIVYLARDHSLHRRVALKEYMPSALAARMGGTQVSVKSERHRETFEAGLKSFVNEARLLAQFDHPSLVKVYRFWEANGTAYMVMPFYEGITLKQQLKDMGAAPNEAWLLELLEPLTEALEVIHAEQCFHRDIAPDNVILLKGSNRPLLLDFGAARRVIGDMTQALTVILKPGYAPVEQYAEVPGMKQGAWTDVYALAAVVYYAIMGKTPPTSVGRLMNDSYVPLVQAAAGRYSPGFLAAIDAALVVKPDDRTASIGDLRRALGFEAVVPGQQTQRLPARPRPAPAPAAPAQSAPAPSRSKLPMIVGGGVVAAAVLGGGLYALMSPNAPPPAVATAPAPAPVAPVVPAPAATVDTAPAPAPAPAAAPVPAGPYDPAREFERIAAAESPDFPVVAAAAKPQFRVGKDYLSFSVKSDKEGYVYVLLHGTDDMLLQVFPNAMAKNNRIQAGQTLTLPPPQGKWSLQAGGPVGTDHFIAIVSAHPRDFSGAGFKVRDGYGQVTRAAAAELAAGQGSGTPLLAGKPLCDAPCVDAYGAALFSAEEIN